LTLPPTSMTTPTNPNGPAGFWIGMLGLALIARLAWQLRKGQVAG
jgi:hypothetical protein